MSFSCKTVSPQAILPHCAAGLILITLISCHAAHAQAPGKQLIQGGGALAAHMEEERAHMAADQRQRKMLQDADKLLELAQQLKVSVDKTDKNTLSVQVVKDAERIEKLARQVKDNMRQ